VVVISSAVKPDNPEVLAARRRDIPVIPRAEMLGELMRVKDGVAVAGSHGKTSTTPWSPRFSRKLASTRPRSSRQGQGLRSNARLGQGEVLVAEADESDGSFRHLIPCRGHNQHRSRAHGPLRTRQPCARLRRFANKVPFYGLVFCAPTTRGCRSGADLQKRT